MTAARKQAAAPAKQLDVAVDAIRRWRDDAALFVREVLGATPDGWQVDVLNATRTHNRIAMAACKGPGKTCVLAWLVWWFLATRPNPKVVATSISGDNLRDGLWSELALWQRRTPLLTKAFKWGAERIVCVESPETWWASARQWAKSADIQQQANTLAGVHGDNVMFVLDESGGIPNAVASAAEGALTNRSAGSAYLLQAGNPTHLDGPLFRAATTERALWFLKEISGDPDDPNRAPRVDIAWAREQIAKYGREHPWVLINVFGKFPPGQSNALIAEATIADAAKRDVAAGTTNGMAKILGVDVARFGDDQTVLQQRQGLVAYQPITRRTLDTMQVADLVAFQLHDWQPDAVFIDATGVGAGVVDRLLQLGHEVIGVDAGGGPIGFQPGQPPMKNRRAEMWWHMAQWLKNGCIPDLAELRGDLKAPTYWFDAAGRMLLESKDDLKARGLASPDHGDALALTFAAPVAPRRKLPGQGGQWDQRAVVHDYDPFDDGRL